MAAAQHVDLLLVQPPVMRRVDTEDPAILRYFECVGRAGDFLGDSPTEPNLGLLLIAANVRKEIPGISIQLVDLNVIERRIRDGEGRAVTSGDIRRVLSQYRADVIGLSFMTSTYGIWGKELTTICKELNPDSFVVLGGIHPTVRYKEVMSQCGEAVDAIVVGEGERAFCELMRTIEGGRHGKIHRLPHVYTRARHSRPNGRASRARLSDAQLAQVRQFEVDFAPIGRF